MTISRRVVAGYAGMLLLVIVLVIIGAVVLVPLNHDISDYSDQVVAQVDAASRVTISAQTMGNNAAMGVLGGESDRANAISQLEVKRQGAMAALDKAAELEMASSGGSSSPSLAQIENLRAKIDEYNSSIRSMLTLDVANHNSAYTQLVEKVLPMGEALDAEVAAYYEARRDQAALEADRLATNAQTMWITLSVVAALAILGGAIMGVSIPRTIDRSLRDAVSSIDGSSAQILTVATQVAAGAAQAAAATSETTATVEEVRQTAMLTQDGAGELAESSRLVAKIAESGRMQAEGTSRAFERIHDQMDLVADAISRLSEQTLAVNEIMTTVNDLAEQSNLLSINASIEAAKAGDHGRGFSVVAQEVKDLAAQSKHAVAQVRGILGEIQRAGRMAVDAAEQGRATIEAGRFEVAQSEEGALSLSDSAGDTAKSAMKISTSSHQQLAGMDQINHAIGNINQAGSQMVEGTRQVEEQVRRLQELSMRLKRLVDVNASSQHKKSVYAPGRRWARAASK